MSDPKSNPIPEDKITQRQSQIREGSKKKRTPFLFSMDVDDISRPITIRRRRILLLSAVLLLALAGSTYYWYYYVKSPSGTETVLNWVEASGGMETWNQLEHGSFVRHHKLYSETGELYDQKSETFYFQKTNGNVKLLVNSKDKEGRDVWIGRDKEGYWASSDKSKVDAKEQARDLGMMCSSEWCNPDCAASMAFYRFSMPFKLMDDGVLPKMVGHNAIGEEDMEMLDVTYRPGVGRDRWVFYADTEDNLIRKIEYHHKSDHGDAYPEEMFWSDYREVGGLKIAHKWARYWTNGKTLEEYTFSDFDFSSPLPEQFEERPEFASMGG